MDIPCQYNLFNVRRASWGTEPYRIPIKGRWPSMTMLLVERNLGTAPNPLTWKASVSLLILIPQNLGFFWCGRGFRITLISSQKLRIVFFILPSSSRRKLLLWYSFRYEPCIAHDRPRCHLITFLESHCSVTFILNPLFRPGIISKI